MEKSFLLSSQDTVTKSNAIARARWPVRSVLEPRLVALVASKVSEKDKAFQTYKIHVTELFGSHYGKTEITELEKAVKEIMSYLIEFEDADKWVKCHIFARCVFDKKTNILSVRFDDVLLPHYLQLKEFFVQYKLSDFLNLPSVYSQRMYEFLKSWANCDYIEPNLEDLYNMMDIDEYMRKDFAQFRIKVLEKSKKDLKKYMDFDFYWEPIRKGRKVKKIKFVFIRKGSSESWKGIEHWQKFHKEVKEKFEEMRENVMACYSLHGDTCVGGYQKNAEKCEFCIHNRNKKIHFDRL